MRFVVTFTLRGQGMRKFFSCRIGDQRSVNLMWNGSRRSQALQDELAAGALVAFVQAFTPGLICLNCLSKCLDADVLWLDQSLDKLERQGRIELLVGTCLNCEDNGPTYRIAHCSEAGAAAAAAGV